MSTDLAIIICLEGIMANETEQGSHISAPPHLLGRCPWVDKHH